MSHHRLSWQVLSSFSAEYLQEQELSGALRIPHGDRDETTVEVWEASSPLQGPFDAPCWLPGGPYLDFLRGGEGLDVPSSGDSQGWTGGSDI